MWPLFDVMDTWSFVVHKYIHKKKEHNYITHFTGYKSSSMLWLTGVMLRILEHVDNPVAYPDIQFWNRASDPVLARDPFSSLMWILFCLPYRFLSCEDSLLSLVHVFYVVSVVQVFHQ